LEEEWRKVPGLPDRIEVSNLGRVRSTYFDPPKILSQHIINSGYKTISLKINGKSKTTLVHRMVARAFCDGYADGLDVNHKDGNRLNNRADNLEWVTRKENIHDCIRRGAFNIDAAHKVAQKKRRRPVAQYTKDWELVNTFESARKAAKAVGVHENCISRVCRGERKFSAGYRWVYLDSR